MVSVFALGHLIEVASFFLFGWCWIQLCRRKNGEGEELLVAVCYGWLLEIADMMIFGTYHYAPVTWFWLGSVPVYIPLLWAVIMHSSMAMSDQSALPLWARPFLDGLLAVLIDLAIDAIAIRLGLWSWKIRLDEGWFGVPPGNLCAWMFVAAWYGGVLRLVRYRAQKQNEPSWHRWLVPVVAYAGLCACLLMLGFLEQAFGLKTQQQRLWLFALQAALFLLVVAWAGFRRKMHPGASDVPSSLNINRWLMHASFFLLLWISGIAWKTPGLIGVSLGAMVLECAAQEWCRGMFLGRDLFFLRR